jgi:hypothetical protein
LSGTEWILGVGAVAAIGVPIGLSSVVQSKLDDHVAPAMERALGVPVAIDDAEVGLSGTFRLEGVKVGELFEADRVEAAVGLDSLLAGQVSADEISVSGPRIRARVLEDGTIDASAVLRRGKQAKGGGGRRKLKRIVVTGGELVVELRGHGELRARDVELHPQAGGVRVVTGASTIRLWRGDWTLDARFPRGGFDLALPELRVPRAALDGGTLRVEAKQRPPLELDRVVVTRGVDAPDEARLEAQLAGRTERLSLRVASGPEELRIDAKLDDMSLAPFAAALPRWLDLSDAHGGGAITARVRRGDRELRAQGTVRLRDARLEHPLLDDRPFAWSASIEGDAAWHPGARQGNASLRVASGALSASSELELALEPARITVFAELPRTECAGALAAIPVELRRGIDGLELSGRIGARVDVSVDASAPQAARLDLELDVGCRVDRDAAPADPSALRGAYTHTLPDGTLRLMSERDPDFTPLDDVPEHVWGAYVAGEDARFFDHDGFDVDQVRKSLAIDVASGRVARGGSTISQQLVKNLWLGRERTLARKLVEAVLTWRLEQRVGKKRILEVYLSLIELGDGVYGIGPAARRWFDVEPRELSVEQAAFLAALTPAPLSIERRLTGARALDRDTRRRVEVILRAMRRSGVIDPGEYRRAIARLPALELRTNISARR